MNFISKFPEDLYPPEDVRYYIKYLLKGEMLCLSSKVLVCGICRNISNVLKLTTSRIEEICSLFAEYEVFLYENDSTDNTQAGLIEWSKTFPNTTLSLQKKTDEWHNEGYGIDRLTAMAEARNNYIDFMSNKAYDYIIVLDMDVIGGYSYDGIKHSIGYMYDKDIDFMGSNSLLYRTVDGKKECLYYDTFAYRELGENKNDKFRQSANERKNRMSFKRGEHPFEVESCFGGLGVYKKTIPFRYTNNDCDHVTVHNQMRKNGSKIFLNPSMITIYNNTLYSYPITNKNT